MSNKYIIRNCSSTYQNFEEKFVCTSQIKEKGFPFYCQDCTDCVMKKIVEKCREAQEIMDKEQYYEDDFDTFNGESIMAERIMDMLEIEECE